MVKIIHREDGEFEVGETEFLNLYYELIYKEVTYAYVHIQLATAKKFAYCHAYVKRFTAETAKEIVLDWDFIKDCIRAFDIERVVGTKIDGIKVWEKFLMLIGFDAENIRPSIIDNKPCMMAVMEL